MTQIPPDKPNLQRLPDHLAQRVLARASEIDASGAAVTDLREAAREAGISPAAFEAALAEVQTVSEPAVPIATYVAAERRRSKAGMIAVGLAVFFFFMMVLIPRLVSRAVPIASDGAPIVKETIQLRCIPANQAAELVRPLVGATGTIVTNPEAAPGVLIVQASEEQIKRVRALLDKSDPPGTACGVPQRGTPAPTPLPPAR